MDQGASRNGAMLFEISTPGGCVSLLWSHSCIRLCTHFIQLWSTGKTNTGADDYDVVVCFGL